MEKKCLVPEPSGCPFVGDSFETEGFRLGDDDSIVCGAGIKSQIDFRVAKS